MNHGQAMALTVLGFIGIGFLIFGITLLVERNRKVGLPLTVVGVVHVLPGLMSLWVHAVGG